MTTLADDHALEDRYALATLPGGARLPFTVVRGEGAYVYGVDGRRYLDLYGGHAVCSLGHSHPRWLDALEKQARELAFYSTVTFHPLRAEAAKLVVEHCYDGMAKVFFCNSGTEANETALKIARKHTGRSLVVAMNGAFHGRTIGALSVTGGAKYRDAFPDNLADRTRFVEPGDLDAIHALPAGEIAAVLVEPIQSVAGVQMAPPDYYRALRSYCTRHGVCLVFDEVQTGNGRTGKWFVGEHWGVEPDIVTTAKGLAGGFPAGAVVIAGPVAERIEPADHASTFGGGPLAAACIIATYSTIEEEGLVGRVARLSAEVVARLVSLTGGGLVTDVRGLGYLLGIACARPAKDVQKALLENGVLVGTSGRADTIRLLPPLNLDENHWREFFDALARIS